MRDLIVKFKHQLPRIYTQILPKRWLEVSILETKATCDDCAMSPKYSKNLKCCTFEPYLPNYIVGEIFANEDRYPEICQKLRDRIQRCEFVLPLGIVPHFKFQIEFNNRKSTDFGNRSDWICPYYDTSAERCHIWRLRGAVCTSFYCKSDHGQKGLKYWDQVKDYLSLVEMTLAEELLVDRGFSPRQISEQLGYFNKKTGSGSEKKQIVLGCLDWKKVWDGYEDDVEGFYIECRNRAQKWRRLDFRQALGPSAVRLERLLLPDEDGNLR